jgi:hypothetical protein
MAINTLSPKPAAVTADGKEPLTPEQIVEQIRMLRQHIPDFGPLTMPDAQSLLRTANLSPRFVQAGINTIGAERLVTEAVGRTAEALSAEREDVGRWSAVEAELRTALEGVAAANLSRRHRIGLATLQAYSVARGLVRNPEYAALRPHVDDMRRTIVARRRRPQPEEPVDTPAPAPVPQKS